MNTLKFSKAEGFCNFKELEESFPWEDSEDEIVYFRRIGYEPIWRIGEEFRGIDAIAREQKKVPTLPRYLVAVWTQDDDPHGCTHIFADDFASLFTLRMQLAQLHQATLLSEVFAQIQPLVERSFHLAHGHATYDVCNSCDPLETKREHLRREARKKKQEQEEKEKT